MAGRYQHGPPDAESFPQFSKLTNEICLMIWECTWPAPRVIEAALIDNPAWDADDDDEDEPVEVVNLRLTGRLSSVLKRDLLSMVVEQGPIERCTAPIALQVCHQSRMHTLSRYRIMPSLAGPFYYHPQRDVIFFSIDVADDYWTYMPILERYHKTELNKLETVLVLYSEWPLPPVEAGGRISKTNLTLECISHLGGLKTVQILWTGSDESSDEDSSDSNEEEYEEEKEAKKEVKEGQSPQALVEHLRSYFPAIIKYEKCTAKKLEVMDSEGNLY